MEELLNVLDKVLDQLPNYKRLGKPEIYEPWPHAEPEVQCLIEIDGNPYYISLIDAPEEYENPPRSLTPEEIEKIKEEKELIRALLVEYKRKFAERNRCNQTVST